MVSATTQSNRIRQRKATTNGKWNKRDRRAAGTPAFSIHPEGYDLKAADAKPVEAPKVLVKPAKKAAAKPKAAKPAAKK